MVHFIEEQLAELLVEEAVVEVLDPGHYKDLGQEVPAAALVQHLLVV